MRVYYNPHDSMIFIYIYNLYNWVVESPFFTANKQGFGRRGLDKKATNAMLLKADGCWEDHPS